MGPIDFIIIGVVLGIVALALWYVIRQKKRGAKCIGCPSGCDCGKSDKKSGEESCSCGCSSCGGTCGGSCGSADAPADGDTK